MKSTTIAVMALAAGIGILAGGCSSRGLGTSGGIPPLAQQAGQAAQTAQSYIQIELLSRPAVKEAFEMFEDHNKTNRIEPYKDMTLKGQIYSFSLNFRSSTVAGALQSILYPNEMKIDLSQNTATAAYLGVESGGATGSKFGGRALSDDIIDLSLGAIFGNTLAKLGVPDDGKELPCLTTDNVGYASTSKDTFPYIQAPI
jgi:hypothetical protein